MQDHSLKTLISDKSIAVPTISYMAWGIIYSAMGIFVFYSKTSLDAFVGLLVLLLLGMSIIWWEINRLDIVLGIFDGDHSQKGMLTTLAFLFVFNLFLSIFFISHQFFFFLLPTWIFFIGLCNHIVGVVFSATGIKIYGLFLSILAFVQFFSFSFLADVNSIGLYKVLFFSFLVCVGLGHIIIGLTYTRKDTK
mgnify:CR=1 FL=1